MNTSAVSRRSFLAVAGAGGGGLLRPAGAAPGKPLRGIFIIMSTPYTAARELDYEDLAHEVEFLERCRVHGIVWPQLASEYYKLTMDERMRGMEVLAKAARDRAPVLVFGVQGANLNEAMQYLRHAEKLDPDALIAIPPRAAKSSEDYREYWSALAGATRRPLFMQTTGGAPGINPTTDMLIELSAKYPNLGYVKEEVHPIVERMQELAAARPKVKAIFSGGGGRAMLYEARLGMDGTMPGAPYADLYPQIWEACQAGRLVEAREIFSKLLLMLNCDQQVPGTRQYIMKKRGVFKTTVSRLRDVRYTSQAIAEIEFHWEACQPYLRA